MFLHLSVILFTRGDVCIQACNGQVVHTHTGQTPPETASEAGGTLPTGIHTCLVSKYSKLLSASNEVLDKVIFSQASVIHSVHRRGRCYNVTSCCHGQHTPWTPHKPPGQHTPPGRQAGGTHPTGMLSCSLKIC